MDLEDIVTALEQAQAIQDPAARATALTELIRQLPEIGSAIREARQAAVAQLHESGWSWAQIGAHLGIHPQRAAQIGKGVVGGARRDPDEAAER